MWRKVLDHGKGLTVLCEVSGTVAECGVSVGVVTLRLKLVPALSGDWTANTYLDMASSYSPHLKNIKIKKLELIISIFRASEQRVASISALFRTHA